MLAGVQSVSYTHLDVYKRQVVGIIMIFITIANVFVQSGFSTALVQKKQADEVDFSSVCYFELAASVVFYALLYLAAPAIAEFYAIPLLKPIVRVLGIVPVSYTHLDVYKRQVETVRKTQCGYFGI